MHVVTVHDPFHPMRGREVRQFRKRRRIEKLVPKTDKPFIVLVDGKPVLRQDWHQTIEGDQVLIVMMLPQGGGGGSNPLRIIGMIAVVAASFVIGPTLGFFLNGALGLGLGTAAATAIGSSLVLFGGSMLLNAIVPPPTANNNSLSNAANVPAASPTYGLQAQGNAARLGQVIPVQYGRLRVYPDFAAQPYVEYANNEQYLYQLMCIGQGEFSVEAIQINDSPITSFANVDYEVIAPGSNTTIFPSNVSQSSEVSGQELDMVPCNWSQSGTTITVTATAHGVSVGNTVWLDFKSAFFTVASAPTADTFTVTTTTGSGSGNGNVGKTIGPFVANGTSTVCKFIGVDLVAPRGMYYANDTGGLDTRSATVRIDAQEVDQSGTAIGSWVTLGTETVSGSTTTAIRKSFKYAAPSSAQTYPRFRVRVTRTTTKDTSSRAGNDIVWGGLRVYMPDTRNYGNITLLAVRAQATNNLSSMSARQINVICTRKIKTVTPTGLSATTSATRSVAAALADIATNTVYGGNISTANIDWAALYALDQTLTARGDYLDVRFDSASTLWEALTQAGVVARTKPFMQGGVMHFVRDQAQSVPVALFSMRNIVQNSMSINYLTPTNETSDSVQVTYFDKTTWQQTTVLCVLTDSTSNNPAKVSLLGITERDQAFREGLYQSAANKYRRKVIKFTTEAEGFIPAFGDLIAIQHDIPAWGQVAEVTVWDSVTKTLTVNEPLTWTVGATHYVGLRKRDGSVDGPFVATQGAAAKILVLAVSPSFSPYVGYDEERTHIAFGPGDAWRQPARVVSVQPRGPYNVEITAVNEDPSVHTAETGRTAPALVYSQLPTTAPLPAVSGLTLVIDVTGATPEYVASWNAAAGADHYAAEISWDSGATWSPLATEYGTQHRWPANRNASASVRVAAVNIGRGAWTTVSVNYSAAPLTPTGFTASLSSNVVALAWAANTELDVIGYEVRTSDTGWGTAGAIFSGSALTCTTVAPAAGSAQTYYVRAIDFLGNYSTASAAVSFTLTAPSAVSGLAVVATDTQVLVSWSKPASPISTQATVAQFEVRTSDTGWGTSSGYVFKGDALSFLAAPPAVGSSVTYYARAIDVLGNYSTTSASATYSPSAVPNIAIFKYQFYSASATSSNVTISWTNVAPQFGLDSYQVTANGVTKTTKSNSITVPVDWIGDLSFTIKTVDQLGNVSTGYTSTITVQPPNSPTNFRATVVDNTVMLYWGQPTTTTLPVSHYVIRRGASWAGYDVDYGRKDGLFTTINESYGGLYTYWVATVDTFGNYSTPVNVAAQVAQPPDFVFYGQLTSTLNGTKANAFLDSGTNSVYMPLPISETWGVHFSNRGWTSPQDQINAGFPIFLQPASMSGGFYEETFDFGTVIPSSRVSLAYAANVVSGSPVVSVTISTSADNATWTVTTGNAQVYAVNFRYVKIRITAVDSNGTSILGISSLNVTLDAKQKNDAGSISCVSTDSSGTVANFNREFIDISSIVLTPSATVPVTAVYDYLDSVITGTYNVTANVCTVTATAHNLAVGQNVRLNFTTGTAPSGVYTVASVINANSYTVALTTSNTSGNVSTYPQGMRIYLFNNSGARVSGTASWSIKGY